MGLWLAAGPVMAQAQQEAARLPDAKPAIEWAIGAGFIVCCLIIGFKNSKRGHVQ